MIAGLQERLGLPELDGDQEATEMIDLEIEQLSADVAQIKARLKSMEKALGVEDRKRLKHLKGHPYLRARMNARALRARIQSKLVHRKFARSNLEKVYRHQVSGMYIVRPCTDLPGSYYLDSTIEQKVHAQTKATIS